MDHGVEYRRKRVTPEAAAATVPSGSSLVVSPGPAAPPALLAALAQRARGGALSGLRVYYMLAFKALAETLLAPDLAASVEPYSLFMSDVDRAVERAEHDRGDPHLNFIPNYFHQVPRLLREFIQVDTFVTTVSPMDRAGFFSLGTSNDYASTAARECQRLIVEVNERMPRVFGESLLHVSEVDAVVEHDAPLLELHPRPPRPEDDMIGQSIAAQIPDGATLQLGIGGIPDAVARYLGGHRDLGIHTELFQNGMVDLIEQGIATGRRKSLHRWKHVWTNALGNQRLYDFIHDNPSMESYPVDYTNNPAVIARNDTMISVNSILEVDLLGQCNAEFLSGHQFSGTGGQLDYVRGAFNSRGGKSFLAFYSTADHGQASRIVPMLDHDPVVTTPRMDTEYLVTEHGMANLKGKSLRQRALALIGLAHPRFREDLLSEAKKMRLV